MKRLCVLVVCFLVVGAGALALGQKKAEEQATEKKTSIPRLASLDADRRTRVLLEASRDRSDLQGSLISQLDPANPKEVNFSIAFLMGLYRMEQSPRFLAPLIALEADPVLNDSLPLWDRYPIAEALFRIGGPAIPELVKNLETSNEPKVRELSAKVIGGIDGPEIARFRLQKAIEKQPDPAKKARLKAAMDGIKE